MKLYDKLLNFISNVEFKITFPVYEFLMKCANEVLKNQKQTTANLTINNSTILVNDGDNEVWINNKKVYPAPNQKD